MLRLQGIDITAGEAVPQRLWREATITVGKVGPVIP